MTDFFKLLWVQFKRTIKLYPLVLIFIIVLALVASVLLSAVIATHDSSAERQKLKIGMVGDMADSYLGIGVFAIQNFDSSKEYIELVNMDEKVALQKLSSGEIIGYALIPENLVDDLAHGRDAKLRYVTNNNPQALGTMLVEEVAIMVSNIVATSNNGAIGFYELAEDSLLKSSERHEIVKEMSLDYFDYVLNREALYKVNILGYSNNLSFAVYYVSAFLIIVIMLWGTVFVTLRTKSDMCFERMLKLRNIGVAKQIAAEFIPHFLIMALTELFLFTLAGTLLGNNPNFSFASCELGGFTNGFTLGLRLLPVILIISILQFLLFEFTSNVISSISLQVLSIVVLSFVSGFIFPMYSMPSAIQSIASYLPTTVAFGYTAGVFTAQSSLSYLTVLIIEFVLLAIMVYLCRLIKMRGNDR